MRELDEAVQHVGVVANQLHVWRGRQIASENIVCVNPPRRRQPYHETGTQIVRFLAVQFRLGTTDMKQLIRPASFWEQSTSEAFRAAVVDFVQRQGAVSGIVKRMEQLGLGAIARSWLATDIHVPIFSEQLHALFGTGALRAFAARLGLQPRDLVRRLSQSLPRILNHLATSQRLSLPMY